MNKKRIIHFHISQGENHYIAEGVEVPVVTQGKTLDELIKNLKEAIELHLDGADLSDLGLAEDASVLADFELPMKAYA